MGQKVNPIGLRVGINRGWNSNWYAEKNYSDFLLADVKLRNAIHEFVRRKFAKDLARKKGERPGREQKTNKRLEESGVSNVYIERKTDKSVKITIFTAKPGIIIGRGGADVEQLRRELEGMEYKQVFLNVKEVKDFATNAKLVSESIAFQLEKRISFRRAIKQAITRARKMGVKGIKVMVAGRLGGAEMSRVEWNKEGRVPLHTLRADIDYGFSEAHTTFGKIGVKTWVFRGEVLPELKKVPAQAAAR
ncbi:MAG: 30S ribosomal protein S3 [Candidatus Wallbacteria bacterium]|nr:30S ribosomal protein S3 [Candidatus Wallbacteria bacterium]